MTYPAYPITDRNDAFIRVGDRNVKLPKPTWTINVRGRAIACSHSIDRDPGHVIIRLMAETHWSPPVEVTLRERNFQGKPEVDLSWSSGGTNRGYTSGQVATSLASIWKVAEQIVSAIERAINCNEV